MNARTHFGMYVRMCDTRVYYVCMYGKARGVKVSCGSFFGLGALREQACGAYFMGGVLTMRFSVQGLTGSAITLQKGIAHFDPLP